MASRSSGPRPPRSSRLQPVPSPPDNPISRVVPAGARRASLEALRDRLAMETDDLKWSKHRAECRCVCGMTDVRALVALTKEIRAVVAELAGLPEAEGSTPLDAIVANVSKLDEHRRTRRPAATRS